MGNEKSKNVRGRQTRTKVKRKQTFKILLLGTGESGKSTIFKQLILSKSRDFSKEEKSEHKNGLYVNIVQGMQSLLKFTKDNDLALPDRLSSAAELVEKSNILERGEFNHEFKLTSVLVEAILALWESDVVKKVSTDCAQNGMYHFPDNFGKLMEKLRDFPEWGGEEWEPSAEDCLMRRYATIGMKQHTFTEKNNTFEVLDVGGQRGERRKWTVLLRKVQCLLYVFSLSDYDQTLYETSEVNRLVESIGVFKSIAASEDFIHSTFIIFLNKVDLFEEKYIKRKIPINISGHFPEAPVVEEDPEGVEAKKWFKRKLFESVDDRSRDFYCHFTCALDTDKMSIVIDKVQQKVLYETLGKVGLLEKNEFDLLTDDNV